MENNQVKIERNPTRPVKIGSMVIGDGNPIAVQSMTATKTTDIDATVELVNLMYDAGADVVRIAVDNKKEAAALAEIRNQTKANLSVDLQENYRMAEIVAPCMSTNFATTLATCITTKPLNRGSRKSIT